MEDFDYKKYLAEGRLYENILDVDVNDQEDYVEVTYNGESYKSALGDQLLFIHNFEYPYLLHRGENDAPEIFKYLKGIGGELEVDDDEATLTINLSDLEGEELKENPEELMYTDEDEWEEEMGRGKGGRGGSFEIGDIVQFSYKGINKSPESQMEITGKRKMFGSDVTAYTVLHLNGETSEYDESQLELVALEETPINFSMDRAEEEVGANENLESNDGVLDDIIGKK